MVRLTRINYIIAGLMFLMVVTGIRVAYSNIQKYGWEYTQTITIGDETTETPVSATTEIFGILFLAVLGGIFLADGRAISTGLVFEIMQGEDDITGITFPKGDPKDWDLAVDLRTKVISVTLNDLAISFPLAKIQGWVDQYEEKKAGETK